jgi:hypothetical protein
MARPKLAILGVLLLSSPSWLFAQETDFYSGKYDDSYREIKYWATKNVSVADYDYGSGDAAYLRLTFKDSNSDAFSKPSAEIVEHFNKEFFRIVSMDLPFHDTHEGWDVRFNELYEKYGRQTNFRELLTAQEVARRRALYGPGPAAVYMNIKI